MTSETQQYDVTEPQSPSFGACLKAAREARGLSQKEAAAQLRLNENMIAMIENDQFPANLPTIFARGYLRSYSQLLQIPKPKIEEALESIKLKLPQQAILPTIKPLEPLTSGNYYMQVFTCLIVLTLIGLVGVWWYTHTTLPPQVLTENQQEAAPKNMNPGLNQQPIVTTIHPVVNNMVNNTAAPPATNSQPLPQQPIPLTTVNKNTNQDTPKPQVEPNKKATSPQQAVAKKHTASPHTDTDMEPW